MAKKRPTPVTGALQNLEFSLVRKEVPVRITPTEGASPLTYKLVEMDAEDRDRFLNNLAGRMRTDGSGKPSGIKDFMGLQSYLICMCLEDEKGEPVEEKAIQAYPAGMQTRLFEACQEMNGLNLDEEEKALLKNA